MKLKKYNSTAELFEQIVNQHKQAGKNSNSAGYGFEDFNMFALPNYVRNDIVGIWDTNDHKTIPAQVIKEIFNNDWNLVGKVLSGSSYGIDKIIQKVDGTYGVVSDKSTLNDTLSKSKIDGLFGLYPKLHKTIDEWIVCSNAKNVPSRVAEVSKGIATFVLYDDYVPHSQDDIGKQKEKRLWKIIHDSIDKKQKKNIKSTFSFKFRNKLQKTYANDSIDFAVAQFESGLDTVKQWGEGSMGLGKSLLDQYIASKVQNKCWKTELTNTNVPININIFDSRRNAKQNGHRLIDIRRQFSGPFKTIWVTQADDVKLDNDSIPHKQVMDINKIVKTILDCNKKNIAVEVITLIHHIDLIKKVEEDLKTHIDGFRWWNYNHDEYDLLATTDRAGPRMGWFYVDACRRWGSTGTPVYTKGTLRSPADNPRMDNLSFYGPRTSFVSVGDAQKAKLIPPLITMPVGVRLSEIANLPDIPIKPKKGVPILETPVKGFRTIQKDKKERYMNVAELARFYAVVKAFTVRPETFLNKPIVGFSNFISEAMLFRENFRPLVDHIAGKDAIGRQLTKLLIMLMNEHKDGTVNDKKIKLLFSEKQAMVISQRLLGRGIDYQFRTAFHIVLKETRQMLQEIFRLMRLNDSIAYDLQTRYYILPVIMNDIEDDKPTLDEQFLDTFEEIIEKNESAKTEMEEIWKSGKSGGGRKPGQPRSFDAVDLDLNDIDRLVKGIAARSSTGGFLATNMERLHTKIFNEMIKMPVPTDPVKQGDILRSFVNDKDFKEIETLSERSPENFVKSIWRGEGVCQNSKIIRSQVQKWQQHQEEYTERRNRILENALPYIRKLCEREGVNQAKMPNSVMKTVKNKLKAMGFVQSLRPNTVSDIIKGLHRDLSETSKKIQSAWYQANVLDKGLTQRQAFLDEVTEKFNLMDRYLVQTLAKKHGVSKKEATAICYHPKIYPSVGHNINSTRYKGLDRTAWTKKADEQIEFWTNFGKRCIELYREWCERYPFYSPNASGVKGRNKSILTKLEQEFGIEIHNDTMRKIIGPFGSQSSGYKNKQVMNDKRKNLVITRWSDLNPDHHETNKWFARMEKTVSENRKKIFQIAYAQGNNPSKAIKAFAKWDLKPDLIVAIKKEFS